MSCSSYRRDRAVRAGGLGARLLGLIEGGEVSHLEWLGAVPSSRATKGLEEQIEKVDFLKALGADRLILPDLPLGDTVGIAADIVENLSGSRQRAASHRRPN